MNILAYILTCNQRKQSLAITLENLRKTDWGVEPTVVNDPFQLADPKESQTQASRHLLQIAASTPSDLTLFLEDDIVFNLHLRHNVSTWKPAKREGFKIGTLYSGDKDPMQDAWLTAGSSALLIRTKVIPEILSRWDDFPGIMQDLRIRRALGINFPNHLPNLIQHRSEVSTWDGGSHYSPTFDANWKRS